MKKNRQDYKIDFLFVILFAAYYLMPSLNYRVNFVLPFIAAAIYVMYVFFASGQKISIDLFSYICIISFIAFLYTVLTDTATIKASGFSLLIKHFSSKASQMTFMFLPLLLFKRIIQNSSNTIILFLLIVLYLIILFVIIVTFRALSVNNNATHTWAGSGTSYRNVANYYFVYAIPFIIVMFTFFVCKFKNSFIRFLCIVPILVLLYFLFRVQYTLAVLITFIGISFVLITHLQGIKKYFYILFLFLFIILSRYILKFLIGLVSSDQITVRLKEVYMYIFENDLSGYNLSGRLDLYWKTIMAFFDSPLYGNRTLGFDGHATFLTIFARLGLLGGIPFYYLYFHANKIIKKNIKNKNAFTPIFAVLLMMGYTNPIHAALPLMFTVWFLVPLTMEYCFNKSIGYNNSLYNKSVF